MPIEVWTWILAAASAFVLLANAAAQIVNTVKAVKAPNAEQNKRLDELEKWRETIDRKLDNDDKRMRSFANDTRVTMHALLALLDHGIDGNNIKQMQAAKEELQNNLIDR